MLWWERRQGAHIIKVPKDWEFLIYLSNTGGGLS